MEYAKLGRTGLEVSRICLGCMSYGVPDRGNHAWPLSALEFFGTRGSGGSGPECVGGSRPERPSNHVEQVSLETPLS